MDTLEKATNCLRRLAASFETARLYSTEHPIFKNSIDATYEVFQDILREYGELVIGIIGEELAFEKEILFELSKMIKPTINCLKERGIEKIIFYPHLNKEELDKFITFLVSHKEGVKGTPQEHLTALGIKNIVVGTIGVSQQASSGKKGQEIFPPEGYTNLYDAYSNKIQESLQMLMDGEAIDMIWIKFILISVMEGLATRYQEILKLVSIKRHDIGTFAHIVNVSILAMHFSSRLGFSKDDVLDIGVAALFHDIGKIYISRGIIGKKEVLTDEEFLKIRSHVFLGAEILLKYVDTLGVLPVVVAFEHHLKYDLGGYPKMPFAYKPHIASLIVSICDVYDALFQRRSYKNDYPPDIIYNIMMKQKGSAFEPVLLDNFFKIMGVWPIGTIVLLNDNRVAVVRQENETDIFSPRVEVIHPQDKKEFIDLKDRKDEFSIVRALNPFTEGEDYLSML